MTERQYNMAVYYAKKYYPQYKSLRPIIKLVMAEKVRAMAKRELPMKTLFTMPEQSTHTGTGHVCGECIHAVRPHRYRHDWLYCKITPSGTTQFGIAKIKARQKACARFKENMKSPLAICPLCGLPRNSLDTPCPKCQFSLPLKETK